MNATRKRKLALRGGIVVLALLAFVIVPGYFAAQPAFLQRYAGLSSAHQTWAESTHAKIACQRCHVAPTFAAQAGYDARMLGEFYLSLVRPDREPAAFGTPSNAACESCHLDLRTVSPSGDLNIPHRAHVSVLELDCNDCHNFLVHEKSPEGKTTPSMAGCLTCHDGETAKADCSACHTDKHQPETHLPASWLVEHPAEVVDDECNACHDWTANWCSDCHAKRPVSHVAEWRALHGAQVKDRRNCEACHEGPFCDRCHGEVPSVNLDPALQIVR